MKYSVNIDEEIKTFEMYSWYIYIFFSVYPYDKNDQLSSLLLVCSLSKQAVEPQRIARQKKKNLQFTAHKIVSYLYKFVENFTTDCQCTSWTTSTAEFTGKNCDFSEEGGACKAQKLRHVNLHTRI